MPKKGSSTIQDRLHRIEGQLKGIEGMVSQKKEPSLIITQLQAVISGLESVKLEIVKQSIKENIEKRVYDTLDLLK